MLAPPVGAVGATDDGTLGLPGAVPENADEPRIVPAEVFSVTLATLIVRTLFPRKALNVRLEGSADDVLNTSNGGRVNAVARFKGEPADADTFPKGRDAELAGGLWRGLTDLRLGSRRLDEGPNVLLPSPRLAKAGRCGIDRRAVRTIAALVERGVNIQTSPL